MNKEILLASVVLILRDMVSLLLTVIIKAPELITDADTRPAETSATSIRDFFVEKIIHSCAHPTSLEAICGHQHNRALVGTDTGSGVVLSLVPTAYVDDYDEKVEAAPSFTSTDQEARDEVIESIKQLGEVLYIGTLFNFDEDDRTQYMGAPDSGFEYMHIDSCVLDDFSSDRVFFFSHGNSILKIYNEPGTPFCRSITRGCTGKWAVRAHFTPEKSENSYKPKYLATRTELPCKVVSDESEVYVYGSKRQHIPVIRQDSEGSTSGVDSDSGHHLGGLCISNAAVTEQISTFVAAEAQACSDARSYYSESDSSDDGDDSRSVASVEYKVDPSHLHVFSNGLQNEDPV
ncbi:hypothetical protein GGH92_007241, partial [Coemansia sp. RSA 2673]